MYLDGWMDLDPSDRERVRKKEDAYRGDFMQLAANELAVRRRCVEYSGAKSAMLSPL